MAHRKSLALLAVVLTLITAVPVPAQATALSSLEVGVKVPLAGFASMSLLEQLRLELSAVIPGFSAPLVDFEGMLAAKLYPGPLELGDLSFSPFAGGGALLLSAAGEMVPGLVVLAGIEHGPQAGFPLTIFAEGSGALLMSASAPVIVFQLSVGARYAFGP